jgi:hypothetical protein
MSDLIEGTEQVPAERPLSAIEAAKARIENFERKLATFDDRARVNRETRAACDPNDKKTLAQLHDEALKISLQKEDAIAWCAKAEADLAAAEAEQRTAAERDRARLARDRFNEFGRIAQQFSDAVDAVVQLYSEMREAAANLHATKYGPAEAQITRWGQRLIVYRCQGDRNLRFEDMMADGRERQWLVSAPKDWLDKLTADTEAVLGPAAQAAE